MSLPAYYQPDNVGTFFVPDISQAVSAGQHARLPASADDRIRTLLLLVDPQVDFIHQDGALSVPGAVDDTRRTIEWLLSHAAEITDVVVSLDSHVPLQIFYPTWWRSESGDVPAPYTTISSEAVDDGTWRPVYEPVWSKDYAHRLEDQSKKQLMIWPYHTMVGTAGHNLEPSLAEAISFHSAARSSQPTYVTKGLIPKTEYYSLLEPEVKVPEDPRGQLNQGLLDRILAYDRVFVAGQAKSHCVLETLSSVVKRVGDEPEALARLHVLEDCTSSVAHPEIDFEAMAVEKLDEFAALGLQRLTSNDPLD
jgi:nicotinamidase/pyrazinamidase